MQQVLANPGALKRFFSDESKIKMLTDTFAGLYSLDADTAEGIDTVAMVLGNPAEWVIQASILDHSTGRGFVVAGSLLTGWGKYCGFHDSLLLVCFALLSSYVLKPQREGGGYNVFGSDIPSAIQVSSQYWYGRLTLPVAARFIATNATKEQNKTWN